MPFYFAYGANMDETAMRQRCPSSRPIGPGRLLGHRFFVSEDGYASVKREAGAAVHGLAWDLALADVPALDRYEEVAAGLYAKRLMPVRAGSRIAPALVYVGRGTRPGVAAPGYMEAVVAAAEACALPRSHLRDLRGWLPGPRRSLGRGGPEPSGGQPASR